MTDDLDEIRAKKVAEMQQKLKEVDEGVEEVRAMQKELTWADFGMDEPPWGFRESQDMPGAFDVCQNGETVALTGDPRWAMLVTDLLNRAKMEEMVVQHKTGGEKDDVDL